ncbi:MAG TPA: type II toxin-antitoxin system death-on-curing family toxin [Steroidobacteraceae bacterium]|nr:type II toxin-antitoxin system death-on-curing family toxin [Steroidobacteraceae bacterium]
MKRQPKWIDKRALLLLNDESLATFGGATGPRVEGLLDSALGRAPNQWHYDKSVDLADLAAACGFGLAKNHAFVDGNKRAAFLAMGLFLAINSKRLHADQVDAIHTILNLAAGTIDEATLAAWVREHIRPSGQ